MRSLTKSLILGGSLLLGAGTAYGQSAFERASMFQNALSVSAVNVPRSTQLNCTVTQDGIASCEGIAQARALNGSLDTTFAERRLEVLGYGVDRNARDPVQAVLPTVTLAVNPVTRDTALTAGAPYVRMNLNADGTALQVNGLADGLAGASSVVTGPVPSLVSALTPVEYGLSMLDERVHNGLKSGTRGVFVRNGVMCDARATIAKEGASYRIVVAPEAPCADIAAPGAVSFALSGVQTNGNDPQSGTLTRTSSTLDSRLDAQVCFAQRVAQGQTLGAAQYQCMDVSAGETTLPLDLAALAAAAPAAACVRDAQTTCLQNGRYEVRISWRDFEGRTGVGNVMNFGAERAETNDSAFYWFFTPQNFEMGVKMVNACVPAFNDKYWVFVSGLTNLEVTTTIRDTVNGVVKSYTNPLGVLPTSVGDINAFNCQ